VYESVDGWTVGRLREHVLDRTSPAPICCASGAACTSEMIAACAKLMSNLDLIVAARKIRVVVHANNTMGSRVGWACAFSPTPVRLDRGDPRLDEGRRQLRLRRRGARRSTRSPTTSRAAG
jgi:ethanolamine ammonia-lyase large subunit